MKKRGWQDLFTLVVVPDEIVTVREVRITRGENGRTGAVAVIVDSPFKGKVAIYFLDRAGDDNSQAKASLLKEGDRVRIKRSDGGDPEITSFSE